MAIKENSSVSAGQQFFTAVVENFLNISIVGFQEGFGARPDLILFVGPYGSTLAVPRSTMYLPRAEAREAVQARIAASAKAFDEALSEDINAVNRFWTRNSEKGIRETNIGREIEKREAA